MDEATHFFKIYHLADGNWNAEMNDTKTTLGGTIPRSLVTISQPFQEIYESGNKTNFSSNFVDFAYPLRKNDRVFVSFPNTARYAPTAYIPQIVAVWVLKMGHTPPLILTYACRLAAFTSWLFLIFWALKIAPLSIQKILFLFAILPASLSLHSSMNADIFTNGLIFLSIALMMRWRNTEGVNNIPNVEKGFLFLAFLLISINKICYFPLVFVLFVVPSEKWGSKKNKWGFISLSLVASLMVIAIWVNHVNNLVYPFPDDITKTTYNFLNKDAIQVNPKLQMDYIITHFGEFLPTFLYRTSLPMYRLHCFNFLGSFGTGNNLPSALGYFTWAIIIAYFTALKTDFKRWERIGMALMAHGMSLLFILSQYLHWDTVGGEISNGHLSKYFIPMYPFLAFALSGLAFNYFKDKKWLLKALILFFIIIHIDMFIILLERFYI
jgi:uncharacterized membrane protein